MKKTLATGGLVVVLLTATHAQTNFHLPPLDRALPPRAEQIYLQLSRSVDAKVAMDVAMFIAPLWRLALALILAIVLTFIVAFKL